MPDHVTAGELRDRLSLIENMIAEGRRSSESWGWMFVLWGATYLIAIAWAAWDHSVLPWPVIIGAALILTFVLGSKKSGKQPVTTLGRAVISIWIALAITMFLLFFALGISGRLTDPHLFISVVSAILGMANGAAGPSSVGRLNSPVRSCGGPRPARLASAQSSSRSLSLSSPSSFVRLPSAFTA